MDGGFISQLPQPVSLGGSEADWKAKTLMKVSRVEDGRAHGGKSGEGHRIYLDKSSLSRSIGYSADQIKSNS